MMTQLQTPDPTSNIVTLVPPQRHDLRLLRAMRQMIQYAERYSKQLSGAHHITASQLVCLRSIVEKGPITAVTLSHEVQLTPSTLVGILDRLEEKQLIVRERDQSDRRRVYCRATEQGRQQAQQVPSALQSNLAAMLATLPDSEQVELVSALERIVSLMAAQQHTATAPPAD